MQVVATAGHVDHGKSTLVRALTGMEPDRWAEERRRGLTIDLGFAWTTLPSGQQVAFVDVPGHERFVTNMLAGVGPVPAVLLAVAADEGWMPQSDEHLRAMAAIGVEHLLLVVTKADVAAADAALAESQRRVHDAGLALAGSVVVSAAAGTGIDELRSALDAFVGALPPADVDAPVRMWIDRAFTIRGAGTVVTGTLPAGRIAVRDELTLAPAGRTVTVRGLESANSPYDEVAAVARVAVNLRGVDRADVARGMALLTAGAWTPTTEVDVLVDDDMPAQVVAHVGSAAVPAALRRLSDGAARVRLAQPLPLHLGDRLLLRDPGSRRLAGARAADLRPAPLRRRGDAQRAGEALRLPVSADGEVRRRGFSTSAELRAAGIGERPREAVAVGGWWVAAARWEQARARLSDLVAETGPLSAGVPVPALRRELALPGDDLVLRLVDEVPAVVLAAGRVRPAAGPVVEIPGLPELLGRLEADPYAAPDAGELARLGLGPAELAHAVRAGQLLRLAEGVYVAPDAPERAASALAEVDGAFTVSQAREVLGSTRRVVVPLLEHLDATRRTQRLPDGKRLLTFRRA